MRYAPRQRPKLRGRVSVSDLPAKLLRQVSHELENGRTDFWIVLPSRFRKLVGPFYFINPSRRLLRTAIRNAINEVNAHARVRRIRGFNPDFVFAHRHGATAYAAGGGGKRIGSHVLLSWHTVMGNLVVRLEAVRAGISLLEIEQLPGCVATGDIRNASATWSAVFPERARKLGERRRQRVEHMIERFGPPGDDDRLAILAPRVIAHAPKVGLIIAEKRTRPRIVQVIVTDPSTGHRHALTVPPRFADQRRKTFQQLTTARALVEAAVAWTFRLKPTDYQPQLSA
jgi:hypothetical protein